MRIVLAENSLELRKWPLDVEHCQHQPSQRPSNIFVTHFWRNLSARRNWWKYQHVCVSMLLPIYLLTLLPLSICRLVNFKIVGGPLTKLTSMWDADNQFGHGMQLRKGQSGSNMDLNQRCQRVSSFSAVSAISYSYFLTIVFCTHFLQLGNIRKIGSSNTMISVKIIMFCQTRLRDRATCLFTRRKKWVQNTVIEK